MISIEEKERLNGCLEVLLERVTRKAKYSRNWICPICSSGSKKNKTSAFEVYKGGKGGFFCHACQQGGDIFTLVAEVEKLNSKTQFMEVLNRTYELLGEQMQNSCSNTKNHNKSHTTVQNTAKCVITLPVTKSEVSEEVVKDYTKYINDCITALENAPEAKNYLISRGLTEDTIKQFRLGYDPKRFFCQGWQEREAIIIPYNNGNSYYCFRALKEFEVNGKVVKVEKPRTEEAGSEPIFNLEALYNEEQAPVFIVEGYFDAISIEQLGYRAVAFGGTGYRKLLHQLHEKPTKPALIIAFDNDERGIPDAAKLSELMKEENILHISKNLTEALCCKDVNEALVNGKEKELMDVLALAVDEVNKRINELKEEYYKKNSVAGHLQSFLNWINDGKNKVIPTGFENFDKALYGGLMPMNLYMLGAISSIGKTAFAMQLADSVAKNGRHVLIFALEMSRNSLIARSISRLTFMKHRCIAKTMRGIIDKSFYAGYSDHEKQVIHESIEEYKKYAGNIFINEGIGDLGIKKIINTLNNHVNAVGTKPVLIVDYLQLLSPYNERFTDKQNTDKAVLELKRISRDYDIPVLCISSFNRSAYNDGAKMEGFKESGNIEYTADLVLGMQFLKQSDVNFDIDKAKEETERDIMIKILKYRDGACGSVKFKYYSKFNYFE
ncbi:MAG: toprim domain-containing protein [Firmicutes bacterium]|nr:toprim domain-containing protein [Bacillota bacterium]